MIRNKRAAGLCLAAEVVLLISVAVAAVSDGWATRVERDDRPAMEVDPAQPFVIEFGRGSGWQGLDTVRVGQDGHVVLYAEWWSDSNGHIADPLEADPRDTVYRCWETTTLQLTKESVAEVLEAVRANGLMGPGQAYHNGFIQDGEQWVFRVKQGDRERSFYFNNSFPRRIVRFAARLDEILAHSGMAEAVWTKSDDKRKHEKELWASVRW